MRTIPRPEWTFWRAGDPLAQLRGLRPQLASSDCSDADSRRRLRGYLNKVVPALRAGLLNNPPWCLELQVAMESESRLLTGGDLDNYLTPLFGRGRLPHSSFSLVTARKRVGGPDLIRVGRAVRVSIRDDDPSWNYAGYRTGSGCPSTSWKRTFHDRLAQDHGTGLPPGPVQLIIVWRSSDKRNWTNLWKPTCDTLGPILGYRDSARMFDPQDDRITMLAFHNHVDSSMRYDVDVGMWWRTQTG